MDCYFHAHVPSVAPCADCRKPICATCRDEAGTCPSCRLAARVDAATATKTKIGGQVPPYASAPYASAPPPPQPPPATVRQASVATMEDPAESRALVALGYPLWPLALISLFDRKQSKKLRRQAFTALGFNVSMVALGALLALTDTVFGAVPFVTAAPTILFALLVPIYIVASVYFGIKTWNGEEVHVPILSDWIDEKIPA